MRGYFCFVVVFVVLDFSSFISGTKTYPRFVNTTPSNPPFESALFNFVSQGCVIHCFLCVTCLALQGQEEGKIQRLTYKEKNYRTHTIFLSLSHKHTNTQPLLYT